MEKIEEIYRLKQERPDADGKAIYGILHQEDGGDALDELNVG